MNSTTQQCYQLCLQGMAMEEKGNLRGTRLFLRPGTNQLTTSEKFTAAHYVARIRKCFRPIKMARNSPCTLA